MKRLRGVTADISHRSDVCDWRPTTDVGTAGARDASGRGMHGDTCAQSKLNKRFAMAFFAAWRRPGRIGRPELTHNPAFIKGGRECFAFGMGKLVDGAAITLQHLRQGEDRNLHGNRVPSLRQLRARLRMCSWMYSASATFLSL